MPVHNTTKMAHRTIKYILFFISFFLWVISVLFIAVGVYARVEKTIEGSASRLISDPAVVVMVVGAMMFAVNFCGCLGSLRENITLLHLYAGILVVIFLLQCVAGMAGFIFKSKVRAQVSEMVGKAIVLYRQDPDLQNLIDYFQEEVVNTLCGSGMLKKTYFNVMKHIYTAGCIGKVEDEARKKLTLIVGLAFSVALIQSIAIILTCCFISRIKFLRDDGQDFI